MARVSRVTTQPSSPSRAYRVRRVPVVRAGVFARSFPVSVLIGSRRGAGSARVASGRREPRGRSRPREMRRADPRGECAAVSRASCREGTRACVCARAPPASRRRRETNGFEAVVPPLRKRPNTRVCKSWKKARKNPRATEKSGLFNTSLSVSFARINGSRARSLSLRAHLCTTCPVMAIDHCDRSHRTPEGGKRPGILDIWVIGSGREHIFWCVVYI